MKNKANKPRLATLRAAQVPWWIPAQPQPAGCQRLDVLPDEMKTIGKLIYSGVAAVSVSLAVEFVGNKGDWITLIAFLIFVAATVQPNQRVRRVFLRIIMPASVFAAMISLIWWRLWMYSGVVGSPDILRLTLRLFVVIDGERSYDVELAEMYLLSLAIVVPALIATTKLKAEQVAAGNGR